MNFSAKSSKNCPISRISMKNRQFGQNVQLFRANHHVSTFGSTFKQKVVKSAPFCEKACKIVDLAKTCNFFEQTTTFCRLGQLFSKKLQKVPHFARKHEKTSIWQKSATFSSKPRCLGVWVNFEAKSASFGEKHEKSSIWPKCSTFWSKLPSFDVSINFSAKSCKKSLSFRKSMKNRRFRYNLQLFRANYHVSTFGTSFQQKVGKSAAFSEKP